MSTEVISAVCGLAVAVFETVVAQLGQFFGQAAIAVTV